MGRFSRFFCGTGRPTASVVATWEDSEPAHSARGGCRAGWFGFVAGDLAAKNVAEVATAGKGTDFGLVVVRFMGDLAKQLERLFFGERDKATDDGLKEFGGNGAFELDLGGDAERDGRIEIGASLGPAGGGADKADSLVRRAVDGIARS